MRSLSGVGLVAVLIALGGCTTNDTIIDRGLTVPIQKPSPGVPTYPNEGGWDFVKHVGDRIFFDYDKSALSSTAKVQLEKWVTYLKEHPENGLMIEGHCDERGTREYNLALGQKRASIARDYLLARGIAASRLNIISYGKERPALLGTGEATWAQNRRAVAVPQ